MWNNFSDRKDIGGVYTVFKVTGLNQDRLINTLKKQEITLYDVKKLSNKQLIVSVSVKESKKFFAIAEELCYNVIRIKEKGRAKPLLQLFRSFSAVIGAFVFVLVTLLCNDTVFAFSFSGSGSIYSAEVESYLAGLGITPFVRFSSFDMSKVEDGILANNKNLSFVALSKQGSRLNLELVLAESRVDVLQGDVYELLSPNDAIIESIKVYRGTAVVKKGDAVKKGDLLVGGYAIIKEQTVKINLLACVTLNVSVQYEYTSNREDDEQNAYIYALAQMGDRDVIDVKVEKQKIGSEFKYISTACYRKVIYAG